MKCKAKERRRSHAVLSTSARKNRAKSEGLKLQSKELRQWSPEVLLPREWSTFRPG